MEETPKRHQSYTSNEVLLNEALLVFMDFTGSPEQREAAEAEAVQLARAFSTSETEELGHLSPSGIFSGKSHFMSS